MNFLDIPPAEREALYALGRGAGYGEGLIAAAEAIQAAGGDTRAILDLLEARRLAAFAARNAELEGSPR